MASEQARRVVTVKDFLRAGSRGEIRIHADCPRTVTLLPCRATDKAIEMPKGHFALLPVDACRILAIRGRAEWRTLEEIEIGQPGSFFEGQWLRFDRWRLADGEESLRTTIADCLVTGRDVHALADAFVDAPDEATEAVAEQALSPSETSSVQPGIGPAISTDALCEGFDGVKFTSLEWRQKIAKGAPDWLKACRASKGAGGASARQSAWYAISVALALLERGPRGPAVSMAKINSAFNTREALRPCREAWTQHRKDDPLLGE